MIRYREYIPRRVCTDDRLKRLRELGIDTTGYDRDMEKILRKHGFGLPSEADETGDSFGFIYKQYTMILLNYADALAEELILLKEHGQI